MARISPGGPHSGLAGTCSAPVIFAYEDTDGILLNHFPNTAFLMALMTDAANGVIATAGDDFDFIGFWANFPLQFEGGFYGPVSNDVLGLGTSLVGSPSGVFDLHLLLGLAGERVQGFLFFTDINSSLWQAGTGSGANFTRMTVNHEFEHRWGVYLPDLLDGRKLQGEGEFMGPFDPCGRVHHWNWRVDGQGSCMEISEWVGANPATQLPGVPCCHVRFNSDIPGGVYSYTDLYLMGMVSPAEMDAGNSELRYMNDSTCASTYSGPISHFSSADIVAAAGPRVPDSTASQKHFRTAWVVIHMPGDPPDTQEIDKLSGILEQQATDWNHSTLGGSTM